MLFFSFSDCFEAAVAAADIIIVDEIEDRTSSRAATTDTSVAADASNDSTRTDTACEDMTGIGTASVSGEGGVLEQLPVDQAISGRPLSAVTLELMAHGVVYTNGKPSGSKCALGMLF